MTRLIARAHAKINWTLEVLGRRDDGYHEIASVMSTVTLWDQLSLFHAAQWSFYVSASHTLRQELETPGNLVVRAIVAFAIEVARLHGSAAPQSIPVWPPPAALGPPYYVLLSKRIPAASGLGGGSSDAAAALRLIARAWRDQAAPDLRALHTIAASLGSDVPFMLNGGAQVVSGRGEEMRPIGSMPDQWLAVVTPPLHVERKTARLYGLLTPDRFTDGRRTAALALKLSHADPRRVAEDDLYNVFDGVADAAFPGIDAFREELTRLTGAPAHLCGAGPSLFALCPSRDVARSAVAVLRGLGRTAFAVTPCVGTPPRYRMPTLSRT